MFLPCVLHLCCHGNITIPQNAVVRFTGYQMISSFLIHILTYINKRYSAICDQICQKGSYTCTVSRHTFHHHLLATSMHQWHMVLILLKVEQSAFTQAFFSSLSGIISTSAWVVFTWPHLLLASRQLTMNYHTTG